MTKAQAAIAIEQMLKNVLREETLRLLRAAAPAGELTGDQAQAVLYRGGVDREYTFAETMGFQTFADLLNSVAEPVRKVETPAEVINRVNREHWEQDYTAAHLPSDLHLRNRLAHRVRRALEHSTDLGVKWHMGEFGPKGKFAAALTPKEQA